MTVLRKMRQQPSTGRVYRHFKILLDILQFHPFLFLYIIYSVRHIGTRNTNLFIKFELIS
jgi:hypothetical protein